MNIIAFVIAILLFVGGLYIMGSAFYVVGAEYPVFIAGILVSSLGVAIPIHVLKRIDG
ncbi:MAG: hypothetical protein ABJA94_04180 [Rhodoglobus sp.]